MWKCENIASNQFQLPIGKWLLVLATLATLATLGASALWPKVRDSPDTHDCKRCGKCDMLLEELKAKSATDFSGASTTGSFVKFFKG